MRPASQKAKNVLDLKEEWFLVPTQEKADTTKRADRSYADRLEGKVLELITVEENLSIRGDTATVLL
jgi:hypothetical protein